MYIYEETFLTHHGILGQKWGVRRYQNPDGSLTSAGKARYAALTSLASDETGGKYSYKAYEKRKKEFNLGLTQRELHTAIRDAAPKGDDGEPVHDNKLHFTTVKSNGNPYDVAFSYTTDRKDSDPWYRAQLRLDADSRARFETKSHKDFNEFIYVLENRENPITSYSDEARELIRESFQQAREKIATPTNATFSSRIKKNVDRMIDEIGFEITVNSLTRAYRKF